VVERPISEKLHAKIDESKLLSSEFGQIVNSLQFVANTRNRLSGGCFDLALEYHIGVIELIESRVAACAFPLLRSLYEAHVRGVWLQFVAGDDDLENYQNGHAKPLDKMVREISGHATWKDAGYAKFQAYAKNILDDYVHAGFRAVSRRISADAIEQTHDEDQEIEALEFANLLSLMSTQQIVFLAGNADIAASFHARHMELLKRFRLN
jgi:hypothetical protein